MHLCGVWSYARNKMWYLFIMEIYTLHEYAYKYNWTVLLLQQPFVSVVSNVFNMLEFHFPFPEIAIDDIACVLHASLSASPLPIKHLWGSNVRLWSQHVRCAEITTRQQTKQVECVVAQKNANESQIIIIENGMGRSLNMNMNMFHVYDIPCYVMVSN